MSRFDVNTNTSIKSEIPKVLGRSFSLIKSDTNLPGSRLQSLRDECILNANIFLSVIWDTQSLFIDPH